MIFRFPILGKSAFRYEKTDDECAIVGYISRHTSIPIPQILAAEDSDLGPFIVIPFVEGTLLSHYLQASLDLKAPRVLNPNIDISLLRKAYYNMAQILVDLSKCQFSHIGGIVRDESKNWIVRKRPVTLNMNQLVSYGNFPPDSLFQQHKFFSTANEYFTALAETHLTHLRTQCNDAVEDEADCRKKYVARCLFRRIARNFSTTYNLGPFPLYCDDLRPSNVIVDTDLNVRSVIDWEFCYAAPVEFTYCSPWWLLLMHPNVWEDGLDSFLTQYLPRHRLFLEELRKYEDETIRQGYLLESQRLSVNMAQSLNNGQFWFCLAAASSFGFDNIYWDYIDAHYYGAFTSIEDRIALLSQEEQADLEPLVCLKMQQAEKKDIDEHRTFDQMFAA